MSQGVIIGKLRMGPTRSVEEIDGGKGGAIVTVQSPAFVGDKPHKVSLNKDQYARYQNWQLHGQPIQNALYDLPCEEREILLTGIGPEKFDQMFGDDA